MQMGAIRRVVKMGVGAIRRVVKQAGNARSSFNLSQQPSRSQRRRQAECPYLEAPSSDNTAQQRLSSGSKEAKHDVPCPSNHGNDGFHIRNTPSQKLFRIHRNRPCSPHQVYSEPGLTLEFLQTLKLLLFQILVAAIPPYIPYPYT